jgi:hypothetical protein
MIKWLRRRQAARRISVHDAGRFAYVASSAVSEIAALTKALETTARQLHEDASKTHAKLEAIAEAIRYPRYPH